MRPPWALSEADFIDACTRCGDCVRACPQRVLGVGDGGFPEVVAAAGECTFCGDCVDLCQPRALQRTSARAWHWRAEIGQDCLTHAGVVCQSCRDACPTGAIRFAASAAVAQPLLQADHCTACGACVPLCPAQAIQLRADAGAPA